MMLTSTVVWWCPRQVSSALDLSRARWGEKRKKKIWSETKYKELLVIEYPVELFMWIGARVVHVSSWQEVIALSPATSALKFKPPVKMDTWNTGAGTNSLWRLRKSASTLDSIAHTAVGGLNKISHKSPFFMSCQVCSKWMSSRSPFAHELKADFVMKVLE